MRLKFKVELKYLTMSGETDTRVYKVEASKPESAVKLAQVKLERMKSFKTHLDSNPILVT
jgi:hypothetical protein